MASRSHVDVNERRLRPIYDCLDNGNNKRAIQEADKVLKKQKDLLCAKVLKALALLRLGKLDDSCVLLEEVHQQEPSDESTLQAMSLGYRELYKLEKIVDLYEKAHKKRPENEDILSALFMAYVRVCDYKKQQQTAMLLHRLQPTKNPYYFWAIMSIVMQGLTSADKNLAKTMFLPLAERMTKKYIDEGKMSAEEEVTLYLMILELSEKWEEALKVLQGPLGEKLRTELGFVERKSAEFNMKLKRWALVNLLYKKLLRESPDHWMYWQRYIASCLELYATAWDPSKEEGKNLEVDYTPAMAVAFIQEVVKHVEQGNPQRGPYLAHLELQKQMRERGIDDQTLTGSSLQIIQQYLEKFGDKMCCYDDVRSFTFLLKDEEKTQLLSIMAQIVALPEPPEGESISYATNIKQMQRHITCLQVTRNLGKYDLMTVPERLALSKEFVRHYHSGLHFGDELLSTDLQYCDNYLLLAVYFLLDIWSETKDDSMVWQAIVQLEVGINNSPSNFQMKILLIRLYNTIGAYGPSHQLVESLECKHIMNDTLGHLVANSAGRLGHFVAVCNIYSSMLRFFAVNHKETTEYLIASYKYGSFSKISEFVEFRDRLKNSIQYSCAMTESMLLDLSDTPNYNSTEQMVKFMDLDVAKDKMNIDDLVDNRDFTLLEPWVPIARCNLKEMKEHSFLEEKAWLKVRRWLLRMLAASVLLGQECIHNDAHTTNGINHNSPAPMDIVLELQDRIASHIQACQSEYSTPWVYPVEGPFRTRLSNYLTDKHWSLVSTMVENVLYAQSLQENGIEKTDKEKEETMKKVLPDLFNELISKHKCQLIMESCKEKTINSTILENLVLIGETLSHVIILAGVCHRILKPLKASWNKKNKKKKSDETIQAPCTFENFNTLVEELGKAAKNLHQSVQEIDPVFMTLDFSSLALEEKLYNQPGDDEVEKDMWNRIERSYQSSAHEVSEFLHIKMQYLNSLRL